MGAGTLFVTDSANPEADRTYIYSDAGITLMAFANSTFAEFGSLPVPITWNVYFEIEPDGGAASNFTVTVIDNESAVPEPSTIATAGLGFAGALALRRRRRRR